MLSPSVATKGQQQTAAAAAAPPPLQGATDGTDSHTFQAIRGQTMVWLRDVSEAGNGRGKKERESHYC